MQFDAWVFIIYSSEKLPTVSSLKNLAVAADFFATLLQVSRWMPILTYNKEDSRLKQCRGKGGRKLKVKLCVLLVKMKWMSVEGDLK